MNEDGLHVVLDLDDVVLAFVDGVCAAVNRDFGATVRPYDVVDWEFGKYIDQYIGRSWWEWLEEHAWLWGEKFKPIPGALGGIEKLRAAGHWIEIVTSKPEWAEDQVWIWLARYKPRVHQVTIANMGKNAKSKSELSPDGDVLVDDRWENCVEWAETGRLAILFSRPHNAHYSELPDHMVRAPDWDSVLRTIALEYEEVL